MRFHIERASGETPPCEGAVCVEGEQKSDFYFPPRVLKQKHWEIEVDSIEQLLELAKLERRGIVVHYEKKQPWITIYDGYIE